MPWMNSTSGTWPPATVLVEVLLNLRSRAARNLVMVAFVAVVLGSLTWMEAQAADRAIAGKHAFLAAGGTVVVVSVEGGTLPAARCLALRQWSYVVAAGGLRDNETVYPDSAPGAAFRAVHAVGDVHRILDPLSRIDADRGVVLGGAAAAELGVHVSSWLSIAGTTRQVVGVLQAARRDETFDRAIILPTGPQGQLEQCWVEFREPDFDGAVTALPAWFGVGGLKVRPLVTRDAGSRDYVQEWAVRPARFGWIAGALLVDLMGLMYVRRRRAEMTLYLTLGVRRVVVALVQATELWCLLLLAAALSASWTAALLFVHQPPEATALRPALRSTLLCFTVAAAVIPVMLTGLARPDLASDLKERPG
jgi:hypothetical protein